MAADQLFSLIKVARSDSPTEFDFCLKHRPLVGYNRSPPFNDMFRSFNSTLLEQLNFRKRVITKGRTLPVVKKNLPKEFVILKNPVGNLVDQPVTRRAGSRDVEGHR